MFKVDYQHPHDIPPPSIAIQQDPRRHQGHTKPVRTATPPFFGVFLNYYDGRNRRNAHETGYPFFGGGLFYYYTSRLAPYLYIIINY